MSNRVFTRSPESRYAGLAGVWLLLALFVHADQSNTPPISAEELFRRASPSVFIVEVLSNSGRVRSLGSGVAVGVEEVATNFHVIDRGVRVQVRRGKQTWSATVTHADANRDLCLLRVPGLKAPVAQLRPASSLTIGERVYAIGAPEGLELTISEGIISGLRTLGPEGVLVQTTAAVSHGSSGGGLFDGSGRLVGITSFGMTKGQNLNFAVPSDWLAVARLAPAKVEAKVSASNAPASRQAENGPRRTQAGAQHAASPAPADKTSRISVGDADITLGMPKDKAMSLLAAKGYTLTETGNDNW